MIGGSLNDRWMKKMRELVSNARRKAARLPPYATDAEILQRTIGALTSDTIEGWSVKLSLMIQPDGKRLWNGSAKLHPPGRSSTDQDWIRLGEIVVLSGAPPSAHDLVKSQISKVVDASAAHHWYWTEVDSEPDAKSVS